jgi:hypothetical protein
VYRRVSDNESKPIPSIKKPNIEIATPEDDLDNLTAFLDVNILDSTGRQPFRGDVLIRGQRIESIGQLTAKQTAGARIIRGGGRTLMAGMSTFAHVYKH